MGENETSDLDWRVTNQVLGSILYRAKTACVRCGEFHPRDVTVDYDGYTAKFGTPHAPSRVTEIRGVEVVEGEATPFPLCSSCFRSEAEEFAAATVAHDKAQRRAHRKSLKERLSTLRTKSKQEAKALKAEEARLEREIADLGVD